MTRTVELQWILHGHRAWYNITVHDYYKILTIVSALSHGPCTVEATHCNVPILLLQKVRRLEVGDILPLASKPAGLLQWLWQRRASLQQICQGPTPDGHVGAQPSLSSPLFPLSPAAPPTPCPLLLHAQYISWGDGGEGIRPVNCLQLVFVMVTFKLSASLSHSHSGSYCHVPSLQVLTYHLMHMLAGLRSDYSHMQT